MRAFGLIAALTLAACGQAGVAQQPVDDSADAWVRHSLAASGVSAEMPCSTGELRNDLFPVEHQVACVHGGVFGLMRDARSLEEIERAAAASERFTVERVSLSDGARALSINRIGVPERELAVALGGGGTAIAVYRESPRADEEGDQAAVDRFFNSIKLAAK